MSDASRKQSGPQSVLVFLVVGTAIMVNLFAHTQQGSPGKQMYYDLTSPKLPNTGEFDWVDNALKQFPGDTNVFLRFEGFSPEHDYALSSFYYRAVSQRFPNRVFVSEVPVIINRGRDLLGISDVPSEAWLREQQVGATIRVIRQDGGKLRIAIRQR